MNCISAIFMAEFPMGKVSDIIKDEFNIHKVSTFNQFPAKNLGYRKHKHSTE